MSEGRKKPRPEKTRRKKHWAVRLVGWAIGLFFLGVIGAAATFFIGYRVTDIPDPNKDFQTNTTIVYYSDGQTPIGSFYDQNRLSVPLSAIPKHVQDAAIAAEDRTFWTNPGISPSGIARAAWNISQGEQLQGGSTITQQYVKILYLSQERTFSRKFKELFISTKLSRSEDKRKTLEGYLNTIYYGEGAYGVRAAGIAYFNKDEVKDLTVPEAAYLATVLNNPSRFDPTDSPAAKARTLERYRYVLDGMRQMGTITDQHYAVYSKALPAFHKKQKSNRYAGPQGFLLEMARTQLLREGFSEDEISGGGLRVTTTFDRKLQQEAVKAVSETHPDKMTNLHIGLASVRPQTGELVAMYGGPDFLKSQLNWATAKARPGSSFKPFAVAAALKDGKSLRDRLQGDGPIEVRGKKLNNEFDRDYGPVTLLKATEESINTAFYDLVDNQMEDGPSKLVDAAEAAGIPKTELLEKDRDNPSTVLGPNAYASPLDMASGYGTFAAEGKHRDWFVIKEVKDSKGKVTWSKKIKTTQAFDEDVAHDTSYALQQVVREGTGTLIRELDRPAAGKTGTAGGLAVEKRRANAACKCEKYTEGSDTLTSWWAGYTPQLSTAVVYRAGKEGESDLDPYSSDPAFFGGKWPARTWLAYMEPAHEGLEELQFPDPSGKQRESSPRPRENGDRTSSPRPTQTPTTVPSTPKPSTPKPSDTPKPTKTPKPSNTPSGPPITIIPPGTPGPEQQGDGPPG